MSIELKKIVPKPVLTDNEGRTLSGDQLTFTEAPRIKTALYFEPRISPPSDRYAQKEGAIYYDADDKNYFFYDGGSWLPLITPVSGTPLFTPSTDNRVVRFNGAGGSIQDSAVSISDTGDVTGVNNITATKLLTNNIDAINPAEEIYFGGSDVGGIITLDAAFGDFNIFVKTGELQAPRLVSGDASLMIDTPFNIALSGTNIVLSADTTTVANFSYLKNATITTLTTLDPPTFNGPVRVDGSTTSGAIKLYENAAATLPRMSLNMGGLILSDAVDTNKDVGFIRALNATTGAYDAAIIVADPGAGLNLSGNPLYECNKAHTFTTLANLIIPNTTSNVSFGGYDVTNVGTATANALKTTTIGARYGNATNYSPIGVVYYQNNLLTNVAGGTDVSVTSITVPANYLANNYDCFKVTIEGDCNTATGTRKLELALNGSTYTGIDFTSGEAGYFRLEYNLQRRSVTGHDCILAGFHGGTRAYTVGVSNKSNNTFAGAGSIAIRATSPSTGAINVRLVRVEYLPVNTSVG